VLVVKLQPVQIKFDRTPRVRRHQFGEIVRQLRLGQTVDLMIEARADAAYGARVRFDGLGLQALELEVLEVGLVLMVEVRLR
jgi:hypothetical protein